MKANFTRSFSRLLSGAAFFMFTLLSQTAYAQPANDLCSNAAPITCGQTLSGTTTGATFDNAGTCSVSNTAPGVWYTITGTGTDITLSTCSSTGYDTKLSVFTGSCGSLGCITGNDDDSNCSFSSLRSTVTFSSTNGLTYYVLVHGFSSATGNFQLTASCAAPPPPGGGGNDLCSDASPIACGQTVSGTTTSATFDNVGTCTTSNTAPGVWYTITGTGGAITLSTCSSVGFDTKLSVFSGSCGALVCVTGNDDDFSCSFSSSRSKVNFSSVLGTTYYVLVHGFSLATGNFELTASCATPPPPPPANDLCSGAIEVTCGQTVSGSTTNATSDAAPFCGTSDGTGGGVWYKLVGNGLPATVSLCNAGTNFDTKLRVYTGSCGSFSCLTGNDDDFNCSFSSLRSTVNFNTANGVTYYILVHGFSSTTGNFELSVECTDPCNPDETNPSITCISGTVNVQLGPDGTYTFSGNELVGSASDACGPVSISYSPATVSCATLGSQVINVTATDGSNNSASCSKTVTVAAGGDLPEEWDADNIGNAHGTATFPSCGEPTYILATNGSTSPSADGLFFVNQPLCGDGSITVKIESVTPQGWAGVMMRETNGTGSKKVGLKTKLQAQLAREVRSTTNGVGAISIIPVPPGRSWLRLTRSGNNFTGHSSPNGVNWYFAFSINVTMSSCIEMGMFAESYNPVDITTAVFTHVSVTGTTVSRPVVDLHTTAPQMDIFPNPVTDELNVNLTGFDGQATSLRLVNGLGQQLLVRNLGEVETATETFSLGNLPKGIYFLSVESSLEQKVFKVIKD